jgi:hypothetical protein
MCFHGHVQPDIYGCVYVQRCSEHWVQTQLHHEEQGDYRTGKEPLIFNVLECNRKLTAPPMKMV